MTKAAEIIDDPSRPEPLAATGTGWQLISDRVMGGLSTGSTARETVAGRPAIRMRGGVSLENNGGFVQIARDLGAAGAAVDASGWTGIQLDVLGNDQLYGIHLRTTDLARPWQSYRQSFVATSVWQTLRLPFAQFRPHRTEQPLRTDGLRRIGLIAIGRAFEVDLAVADIRFYADAPAG